MITKFDDMNNIKYAEALYSFIQEFFDDEFIDNEIKYRTLQIHIPLI